MIKPILIVFGILLSFVTSNSSSLQCSNRKSTEDVWLSTPTKTSEKIKTITTLNNSDLKQYYLYKILKAGFEIDTNSVYKNHFRTLPKRVENKYIELTMEFNDSTAIIYGRYGSLGLNAFAPGAEPSVSNIDWNNITYDGWGWDILMIMIGDLPGSIKQYNR